MVFHKCLEEILERSLPIDNIIRVLNCSRLRWQQAYGHARLLSSPAEHELIPLESIGRYASLVRKDFAVEVLSKHCPRKFDIR